MQSARTLCIRAQVLARSSYLLVAAVSMSFVSMSPALVQAQDKRAAVLSFDGQRAAKLREAVVSSVSEEITVVPNKAVQSAASEIGADLSTSDGRIEVARELEIDAFIEGRVDKAGRNWVLVLSVASGSSGEFAEVAELTAKDPRKLAARAETRSFSELSAAIAQSERPAKKPEPEPEPIAAKEEQEEEPEPEPEEAADDDDDEAAQDDPDDGELPMALAIELGAGGFSRDFEYRENIDSLPVYDIAAPPLAFLGLQWFPAAHFSDSAAAHIGLRARGQMAFGLSSGLESGSSQEFDTTSTMIEIGVRGRLPLSSLQLGADVSYGSHTYKIDSADTAAGLIDPGIPSASYSYLKFHIDASLALGDSASIGLGFGLMPMLGLGEIEEWFPQASGLAMEGDINFAYALMSSLDLVVSLGARRYAVTLEPSVDDVNNNRPIAAGLVDQYIAGQIGLRFRLGGTP
jgi:hypothetical protein